MRSTDVSISTASRSGRSSILTKTCNPLLAALRQGPSQSHAENRRHELDVLERALVHQHCKTLAAEAFTRNATLIPAENGPDRPGGIAFWTIKLRRLVGRI